MTEESAGRFNTNIRIDRGQEARGAQALMCTEGRLNRCVTAAVVGLVLAIIWLVVGCQSRHRPYISDGERRIYPWLGVSIILPSGWVVFEDDMHQELSAWNTGPNDVGSGVPYERIMISRGLADSVLDARLQAQFNQLYPNYARDTLLLDTVKIGEHYAARTVSTEQPPGSSSILTTMTFKVTVDSYLYTLDFTSMADSFSLYRPPFERVASTFSLE
jgi:hypothetical protein